MVQEKYVYKTSGMPSYSLDLYSTLESANVAAKDACDYGESFKVKKIKVLVELSQR